MIETTAFVAAARASVVVAPFSKAPPDDATLVVPLGSTSQRKAAGSPAGTVSVTASAVASSVVPLSAAVSARDAATAAVRRAAALTARPSKNGRLNRT
jgi:hypothetical protein